MREPVFDGFTKTGEKLSCSACDHTFASEEDVVFKQAEKVQVFTEADRPDDVEVFTEDDQPRFCRHCKNYLVNPFTQWCSLHNKEVEATMTCDQFERKEEEDEE